MLPRTLRTLHVILASLFCVLGASTAGFSAILQTDTTDTSSDIAIGVSSVDLIDQPASTVSSTDYTPFNNGTATSDDDNLNDGSAGASVTTGDSTLGTVAFDLDGTWVSTFNLDVSVNTLGYDITQIDTIAGWGVSRSGQNYELLYSIVGNVGFTSLGSFSIADPGTGSTRVRLTDTTLGASFITGVDAVRFSFTPSNTQQVYREIDVFGVPTVPEPSSLALAAVGAIAGIRLTRRRRSA